MAGGIFDINIGKVRPGTYINVEAKANNTVEAAERGIAVVPIVAKYGKAGSVVEVTSTNANALKNVLGFSVYDNEPSMLPVREALKHATTVKVYILAEGKKATITSDTLTATALFGGSRGNDFTVTIVSNPTAGFDVSVYLSGVKVEIFEKVKTVEELIAKKSEYLEFAGTGNLTATAGAVLTGGEDGNVTNAEITKFLDNLENITFNAVAFPIDNIEEDTFTAIKSKIKYLRDTLGKTGQFVVANYAADYEGIINVTNGVNLSDGTKIDSVKATAFVAGITAGALYNESNTYKVYDDAVSVVDLKTNEKADIATKNGELYFSLNNAGEVVIDYDINSLCSSAAQGNKPDGYKKNRYIRVIDTLLDDLKEEFAPAKYDNNEEGWDLIEGRGNAILKQYESDNAINNVDYEKDFLVDRNASNLDATYINISIAPLDSAEKIYITVRTA